MKTQKRKVSFIDATGKKANIKLEITHRNGYPEFTASGEYNGSLGQCLDNIKPSTEAQKKIIEFWNLYHLNGMSAGTPKQNKVLENCESKDYSERCEFLSMHSINGEPLTAIETKGISAVISENRKKIEKVNEKLKDVEEFQKEWNSAKRSAWNRTKKIEIIKIMKDNSDFGDFRIQKNENDNTVVIEGASFFKESGHSRIPSKYNRRLETYVQGLENQKNILLEELKKYALRSALYDIHPTSGELYKYGTEWIKESLPSNLWEEIENICKQIEEEEEERTEEQIKIVDPNELEEGDERHEIFEDNQINENCGALALFLGLTVEEMSEIEEVKHGYGNCLYEVQGQEYYCGTNEEIFEAVKEYCENSAWAFNNSFLSSITDIPEEAFKGLSEQCENGNDGIIAIIEKTCGIRHFTEESIDEDGFGHFLNHYDGTGNEIEYNNTKYFICRS